MIKNWMMKLFNNFADCPNVVFITEIKDGNFISSFWIESIEVFLVQILKNTAFFNNICVFYVQKLTFFILLPIKSLIESLEGDSIKPQYHKKSRVQLAKKHTSVVRNGKYRVSSHAQNKIVLCNLPKSALTKNLHNKPKVITPVVWKENGPSYRRINKETVVVINPETKKVITIYPLGNNEAKKYGIKRENIVNTKKSKMRISMESNRKNKKKILKIR